MIEVKEACREDRQCDICQTMMIGGKDRRCNTCQTTMIGGKHWRQHILDQLLPAIRLTAAGMDVSALRYDAKTEMVHVDFESGKDGRIINVAHDSGWGMIKDVVNNLDIG